MTPLQQPPTRNYQISQDIAHREIEGQILLLLPGSHYLYTLNESGQLIWEALLKKRKLPRIIADFAKHFGIPAEQAEADVLSFLEDMSSRGIVTSSCGQG
jgi:hypothetical protein